MQLYIIENLPIFAFHSRQAERVYKDYTQGKYKLELIIYMGKVYRGLKV